MVFRFVKKCSKQKKQIWPNDKNNQNPANWKNKEKCVNCWMLFCRFFRVCFNFKVKSLYFLFETPSLYKKTKNTQKNWTGKQNGSFRCIKPNRSNTIKAIFAFFTFMTCKDSISRESTNNFILSLDTRHWTKNWLTFETKRLFCLPWSMNNEVIY